MLLFDLQTAFWVFAISAGLCGAIVLSAHYWPQNFVRARDLDAVQAAHHRPTSRLGGAAIILTVALAILLVMPQDSTMPLLLLSVVPIFMAGLIEDMGMPLSPRIRLAAASISALLAVVLLQSWITHAGIPLLDPVLALPLLAIPMTLIWGTGLCHSFNLIDGVNGLSSGNAAISALGLAAIAHQAGQPEIALAALLLVPAILGFMAFNWPMGRIFLGDAGAYSLGHLLVWLSILLIARAPDVSVAVLAGLFFWPLADTMLAVYRRWRAGSRQDQADRLHSHQLLMRGLEIIMVGRQRRHISNPLTTALLLPLIAVGIWGHVQLWQTPWAGYLLLCAQGAGFVLLYKGGMRFFSVRRRRLVVFRHGIFAADGIKPAE